VLACAKHFLGDGGTQGGVDQGDTRIDEAALRKIHLPGYGRRDQGRRPHHHGFLQQLERQEDARQPRPAHRRAEKGTSASPAFWFPDWAAIDPLSDDYKSAIETSINAGLDMVMIPNGPGQKNSYMDFIRLLKGLVADGRVPQERIDDAVRRILRVKTRTRLFDHPFSDPDLTAKVGCDEHRQVARECVRQSLVLLKNENHALPLAKKAKRLVVTGKAADDLGMQCGGWTIDWQGRARQGHAGRHDDPGRAPSGGRRRGRLFLPGRVGGRRRRRRGRGGRRGALRRDEGRPQGPEPVEGGHGPGEKGEGGRRPRRHGPAVRPAADPRADAGGQRRVRGGVAAGDGGTGRGRRCCWAISSRPASCRTPGRRTMDQVPCNVGEPITGDPLFAYDFGLTYG